MPTSPRRIHSRSNPGHTHGFIDADTVIGFLGRTAFQLLEPTIIGFEPAVDSDEPAFDLHLGLLRQDPRGIAAGLFGLTAPPEWNAVAVTISGSAIEHGTDELIGAATGVIAVDRHGGVASTLCIDDEHDLGAASLPDLTDLADPNDTAEHVEVSGGSVVDALHRVLGRPCPGVPPSAAHMALALWYEAIVVRCEMGSAPSWDEAVSAHPGSPCTGSRPLVHVSTETVVEATLRTEGTLSWQRMHRKALGGHGPPTLSTDEIAWMDPTFYARWIMGTLPDVEVAVTALNLEGEHLTAERVAAVAAEIRAHLGPPSPYG